MHFTVVNKTGAPAFDVVVRVTGGSWSRDVLQPDEAWCSELDIAGDSGVSISWIGSDRQPVRLALDTYLTPYDGGWFELELTPYRTCDWDPDCWPQWLTFKRDPVSEKW